MSLMMSIRRKPRGVSLSRFGRMQMACRMGASSAAERIGPAARGAREAAAKGVLAARGRSAPWLRRAGAYVAAELGPRVGRMLSDAAERVEPQHQPVRRRRAAAMALVGVASAVGLVGALMTRRANTASMPGMMAGPGIESVPSEVDGQVRSA